MTRIAAPEPILETPAPPETKVGVNSADIAVAHGPLPPELWPDVSHIVTEDDTPVDSIASAKQARLLIESLYDSWMNQEQPRKFLADTNVGVFAAIKGPPLVPDVFVSDGVEVAANWWEKPHRSYFIWEYGKPPDVVVEIVSNREGGERDVKWHAYARMCVLYYVIYDPADHLRSGRLAVYALREGRYEPLPTHWMTSAGLGVTIWEGEFEGKHESWLRWTDREGAVLLTGSERAALEKQRAEQEKQRADQERERAEQEKQRAEQEKQRADQERERAEQEKQRAERLAAQLQRLGIDPDK